MTTTTHATDLPREALQALIDGRTATPHDHLGAHAGKRGRRHGVVVRALQPDAASAELLVLPADESGAASPGALPMVALGGGVFECFVAGADVDLRYRFAFVLPEGRRFEREDPYRLWPTLGDHDLHLFNEGRHMRLWEVLGAHTRVHDGVAGTAFAVWAPNAERVSVVGDFCGWDGRTFPMRMLGASGIFELFIPGVHAGALYQYEIRSRAGEVFLKADPFARESELPPRRASCVPADPQHVWRDEAWQRARRLADPRREPMAVYEVHFGSFRRAPDGSPPGYRTQAESLVRHALHLGFTHIELMPLCEHPFDGSWGYQVTGFFAPTARYGSPDDLRYLVDLCHQHGLGVILDWVPAHFPRDSFALARFDGTALYEHEDPRRGEHPDWGTYIFNYGRHEVRNFLVASALYWLQEFHVDGLRVDAVASMLYRDYSRQEGEWVPGEHGAREDADAVAFLRELNQEVRARCPSCFTVAEESTAWPGVTAAPEDGGLGFTFKWNLGWMHDTLGYFGREPVHRSYHQNDLTFAMMYEHSERFINPLSHDEVVHGKGSLYAKMAGDPWQKLANLRALYCYQYTRPGKKLLFMGSELAPEHEWNHDVELPWAAGADPARQGLLHLLSTLGAVYRAHPALWRGDPDVTSFEWIDTSDHAQSVLSFCRRDGADLVVVVLNLTPVPRDAYRVGVPGPGRYRLLVDSDATRFGGSGYGALAAPVADAEPRHDRDASLVLTLPPLSALVYAWDEPPAPLTLAARAREAGVLDAYYSIDGALHVTSDATRARLCEALAPAQDAHAALKLDAVRVVRQRTAPSGLLPVDVAPDAGADRLRFRVGHRAILDVDGARLEAAEHASGEYRTPVGRVLVPWTSTAPALGHHTLHTQLTLERDREAIDRLEAKQELFVVPETAEPTGKRGLGLWVQLYALRREGDWGIGDMGHLARLVEWAAALGLDFVGLSPMHAASLPDHPISPYFPSSRLYRNPLYIDLDAVPELAGSSAAQAHLAGAEHRALRERLQRADDVDYRAVEELKRPVLELLADAFLDGERGSGSARDQAFARYLAAEGEELESFATFCVLQRTLGEPDSRRWSAAYRDAASPERARFATEHARAIERERFYQFELDRQLGVVAASARDAGMGVGLYLDLAVGSTHGGYDAFHRPALLPAGVTLGAPPDALAPHGQDWGITPLSPTASRAEAHDYFRRLLTANMRHAGALRIDHVMGLMRQFWIAAGDAAAGAYVREPLEELLGLCAAESRRAQCLVVGEDLGTVPDGLRDAMAAWGLLRMQVARFEIDTDAPAHWARDALGVVGTHDLPPFASLWHGSDLELRHSLDLCDADALARARDERAVLRRRWIDALVEAGHLPSSTDPERIDADAVLDATHLWLAAGPCQLVALSLADLCGDERPANIPGTTSAHGFDSWCARHPRTLESITADTALAERIRKCLAARG